MSQTLKTRTHEGFLGEDGIIYVKAYDNLTHNIQDGIAVSGIYQKLSEGKKRPVVCDMSQIKGIDRECREYYAGEEHNAEYIAIALVVKSKISRVIGNFFLGINKPINPTTLVDSVEDGVTWANKFL